MYIECWLILTGTGLRKDKYGRSYYETIHSNPEASQANQDVLVDDQVISELPSGTDVLRTDSEVTFDAQKNND